MKIRSALTVAVASTVLACATTTESGGDCLAFEVLDTHVDGSTYSYVGDEPVLVRLDIGQRDVDSVHARVEIHPDWLTPDFPRYAQKLTTLVDVQVSDRAGVILSEATTEHALKFLRISRASFESRAYPMIVPIEGRRMQMTTSSEADSREFVAMLSTPCP